MNTPRDDATTTLLPNGQVLVAGGYNGSGYLSSAELYNPATGIWSVTGSLNTPRDDATATLLPNGLVLVAYGYNGSYLSSEELYNPATGIWSFAGSLNIPREDATATLLPNGTVLFAGGYYSYSGVFYPVNDSEVYYYTGLPTLLTIAVTPASPNLPKGLTQQLTATGTYSDGTTQNLTSQVTWALSTSSVATVSPTGLATGVAQGTSLITASLGGVVSTTADSLTVTVPILQTITVSPATLNLAMGLTQQFTATGTYSDGTTQNLTSQVTWASATSSVANISFTGMATAVGVGTSAITASFAGVTNAPLLLVVTAVGSLTNTWAPAGAGNGTVGSTATLLPNGLVLEAGGFAGGFDGTNLVSSAELYNPATDIWSVTGSLNTPRAYATATLLPNGLVLVAGGVSNGSELSSAELYNPATGAWSYTGSLNTGRAYATTTLLPNGQVLVAGGYYGSGYLASAELYNPATGIWSYTGNLNTGRDDATATLLPNGQVLVAGGENGSAYLASGYLSSAELYNPATGIWSFTGSLNFARSNDTATLLPNGQVLVAGGYNGSADLPTTELYNPTTGVWSGTGYLNTPRDLATATLLTNGQVLVAGGDYDAGSGGFSLSSAELYNPATGVWSVTGTLNQPRENATATLLPDGQVLVAGGDNVAVSGVSWVGASEVYGRSLLSLAVTTVGPPTVWAPFISSTGLIESQDEALNPRQFIATGTFSDGTTVDLTGAVTWQSSNSAVAAILPPGDYRIPPTSANSSPSGWVLGVAAGTSSITASYDGVSSTPDVLTVQGSILQSITVTPGNAIIATGSTQQFTATGVFSDGTTQNLSAYGLPWIPGPQLPEAMTWTSGTSSVATISSTGLATGLTTGTSTITLVYSVNGTIYSVPALLTVAPPILQSITVTPANPAIAQGLTQQFTATGTYSDGSTQDLTSQVTWASGTSSVVTISSAGLATGVAAGTSSITASLNGVAANTAVTVKTLQSISVAPANSGTPTVTLGGTLQFTATGRCIDGSTENLTSQVTWAVVPPVAAAVVSPTGLVAGVGQGTSTIMASLNGLTATSVVTVITLQSITVTPANSAIPTVALGGTQQFTATGTYSDGSTQNLTSQVSWSVVPSIVATISSTGLATGQFANAAVIRAVLGGVEGDSSLVVTGLSPAVGNTPSVTTDFARGGTAFAQDVQPGYSIAAVNDGIYGSASSWIGTSVSDFVGISFGTTLTTLCGVAWSRDNTGVNTDRSLGTYTLQYTTVANPSASTPASAWTTIGSVTYTSATWLQHVYAFNPVQVTGIRLETQSASASNLIAIDELSLYAQSPVFTASDGSVYVLGTSGNDNIYVAASRTTAGAVIPNSVTVTLNTTGTWGPYATNGKPVTVFGYAGDDTIAVDPAFTGPTNLFGGDGNDTLTGGGGNDYIDGGAGTNYEVPSAGNDTIVNASGVVVHGDPGNNAISFSWHPGADPSRDILVESINGRTYSMDYTPADNAPNLTIEVVGGSGNNTLVMGPDPAGKWNTVFIGGPKTNILVAGPNNPSALLVGGSGTNILVGGGGKETIEGGSGVNTIYGGTGTDTIIAGTGKTTIIGGTGHMTIENFTALDTLTPGKGSYTVAPGSLPASGRGAGIDAFVAMVYSEELGRVDDPAGLQYWARRLSARLRPLAVVTDIADSPEHLARLAAGAVSHLSASRVDDDALAAARRARGHLFASNSIPRGPLSSRTLSRQAPAKTRPSPRDALSQAASRTRRSIVPIDRILGV
ncbi:MAG: kelch repeat-containing protein [Isosphaeraceae bacterium]